MQLRMFGGPIKAPEEIQDIFYPDRLDRILSVARDTVAYTPDAHTGFTVLVWPIVNAIIGIVPEAQFTIEDFLSPQEEVPSYYEDNLYPVKYASYEEFLKAEVGNLTEVFWPYGSWYIPLWGVESILTQKYTGPSIEESTRIMQVQIDVAVLRTIEQMCRRIETSRRRRLIISDRGAAMYCVASNLRALARAKAIGLDEQLLSFKPGESTPDYLLPLIEYLVAERRLLCSVHNIKNSLWLTLVGQQHCDDKGNIEETIFKSFGHTRTEYKRASRCASRSSKDIYHRILKDAGTSANELYPGKVIPGFESGHGQYEID